MKYMLSGARFSILFWLALALYLTIAYNSSGYHQEDEHYQIIEFANYKLGLVPKNRLAWEFAAQIRPGLQPMICYIFLRLFNFLSVTDGYDQAFLLRAVTALIAVMVIKYFVEAHKNGISKNLQLPFAFLSFFLWFLPYINVRFSSETWSGLAFLVALGMIQHNRQKVNISKYIGIGIVLGISVLLRYQSALLVAGIGFWFLIVDRISLRNLISLAFSFLGMLFLGWLIDVWLYGQPVFSIYNYFNINLIQGVSSNYGINPWYEYVYYVVAYPGPFGIVILASFFIILYFFPKNVMLWAVLPFIVVHSLIPHKELRFLFTISNLTPLFLIIAYQKLYLHASYIRLRFSRPYGQILLLLLLTTNTAGLYAVATTGAGTCRTVVTEYIHRHYPKPVTRVIVAGNIRPYMDWGPPKNSFYSSTGIDVQYVESVWQPDFLSHQATGKINLLVIPDSELTGRRTPALLKRLRLVKVYQNLPPLTKLIYKIYDPEMLNYGISVYEFKL